MKTPVKVEWWYDYSDFSYEDINIRDQILYLRRLSVFEDGTAEALLVGSRKFFPTEEDARLWLGDEENWRLASLLSDFEDDNKPVDARIVIPNGATDEELFAQMVIPLPIRTP